MGLNSHFGGPRPYAAGASEAFRTVSHPAFSEACLERWSEA